jgi:hypothetical protein
MSSGWKSRPPQSYRLLPPPDIAKNFRKAKQRLPDPGHFFTAFVPRTLPTPTTSSDGFISTTKRARWRPFNVKCVDPSFGCRKGRLWYSAGSSRLGFRQRSLDYDSGTPPPTHRWQTSDSRLYRIRWSTLKITSSLGGLALLYAKHSTGD